jgi:uncharacterized protein (UPF0210 family)
MAAEPAEGADAGALQLRALRTAQAVCGHGLDVVSVAPPGSLKNMPSRALRTRRSAA